MHNLSYAGKWVPDLNDVFKEGISVYGLPREGSKRFLTTSITKHFVISRGIVVILKIFPWLLFDYPKYFKGPVLILLVWKSILKLKASILFLDTIWWIL